MPRIFCSTISETYLQRIASTPKAVGFQYKNKGERQWQEKTFEQFHELCAAAVGGLRALGLRVGDKVAILSETRFEWTLADLAIIGSRGITVPVYPSNAAQDAAAILAHSETSVAFVEDRRQLTKVLQHRSTLPALRRVIIFNPQPGNEPEAGDLVVSFDELLRLGRERPEESRALFEKNLQETRPEDVFSICYTSGTTGVPKGAMLTHANMMSVLGDCVQALGEHVRPERETLLAFLPFSHILGRVESMGTFAWGWRECYTESLGRLMQNIAEIRPTIVFSVPRIFEKAYSRIHAFSEMGPRWKHRIFSWALSAGQRYWKPVFKRGEPRPLRSFLEYPLAQLLVFGRINRRFGGRLRFAICGGAPLPREIGEFFHIAGIPILEGYGLTETCAPVAVNLPDTIRFASVGRPLPEVLMRVADDGELCIKSRKVFQSYYKMPEETREVFEDDWFRTGDIGYIDPDGFIYITDRKKDLIITSGGKNIAPQKIENMARSHRIISQFVVYGDRRNFLTALVTLDKEQVLEFARREGLPSIEYRELVRHPAVQGLVQRAITQMNVELAAFEAVKKFCILPQDFSVETGELTPSLKVKRSVVARKYQSELDSLYCS